MGLEAYYFNDTHKFDEGGDYFQRFGKDYELDDFMIYLGMWEDTLELTEAMLPSFRVFLNTSASQPELYEDMYEHMKQSFSEGKKCYYVAYR